MGLRPESTGGVLGGVEDVCKSGISLDSGQTG